jgi:hypothetical protein
MTLLPTEKKELQPRRMRVVDFTAESYEEEANALPPIYKKQAEALRNMAATLRKCQDSRMVRVWE